jgi:hypothetical protein
MSISCNYCGAVAGKGFHLGHRVGCPSLKPEPWRYCKGCWCPLEECQPLWKDKRKCCPDCSHTPTQPKDGFSRVFDEQKASRNPESLTLREAQEAGWKKRARDKAIEVYPKKGDENE